MTSHQRTNTRSNAHVGREFEGEAAAYFVEHVGLALSPSFSVPIGVAEILKPHRFDLGSEKPPLLVECKSHTWTETGNMPSAKITVWNEAMYYFLLAPTRYRKVLFVLEAMHPRRSETLAEFYARANGHLIPSDVSIIEFNPDTATARTINQQRPPGVRVSLPLAPISAPKQPRVARPSSPPCEAYLGDFTIRQMETGTIEVLKDSLIQSPAMPLLHQFAAHLGVDTRNGQGNPMNTRQLGAALIRSASPDRHRGIPSEHVRSEMGGSNVK
ncbi:hypothetical protein [Acidithiobacillus ferrivorans]|uniref:Uncharacterized protein n=1 Tax=Acidithiobacillus ferrivorans TaxID=160808 RepID=A0A7T5BG34_9PROT|nr:hypothetical protein [Acidithiobacillus ferrivorans]QQD71936.1 hypothetical protein H2515_10915 [Acidithiobacillus ferrivorans]